MLKFEFHREAYPGVKWMLMEIFRNINLCGSHFTKKLEMKVQLIKYISSLLHPDKSGILSQQVLMSRKSHYKNGSQIQKRRRYVDGYHEKHKIILTENNSDRVILSSVWYTANKYQQKRNTRKTILITKSESNPSAPGFGDRHVQM